MNPIQSYNFRAFRSEVPPEVHNTPEALRLKEATKQFESILWSQIWSQQMANARALGGNERERPWRQMEDMVTSMATEEIIVNSGGAGLWKMLYNEMIVHVAASLQASGRLGAETDTTDEEA